MRTELASFAVLAWLWWGLALGAVPQYASEVHLGVASCASSQCHGSIRKYKKSNILRNEYRTWSREDAHARAYGVLRNKASKLMAKKLGIGPAHRAKLCLDCHADNVPAKRRGKKFQLSDGIGCEACHGGARKWIETHTEKGATHADNLALGMYPTEQPLARAKLCLSCHYGDRTKFATHAIMAVGHPRLSFELDTFTLTQTHYDLDADYLRRKTFPGNVPTWATGVVQTARQNLLTLDTWLYAKPGVFPEIALFDCHACHHPMNDIRWRPKTTTIGLPAGAIRLNDSALVMSYVVSLQVDPQHSAALLDAIRRLHRATLNGRKAVRAATERLGPLLQTLQQAVTAYSFDRKAIRAIRKQLFALGRKGEFRDYSGAEQVVMAIDLLSFALQDEQRFRKRIDGLYAILDNESTFRPSAFARAMAGFATAVKK